MALLAQTGAEGATGASAELWIFLVIGALSLGSALAMILMKNTVHAALMLVVNFFTIAVLYAVLQAQFLFVVQMIVYAGAIMVLFLFVLMLLGVYAEQQFTDRIPGQKTTALLLGVLLLGALAGGVAGPYMGRDSACNVAGASSVAFTGCRGLDEVNADGNVRAVGLSLFTRYVWPFEVMSVLLVIAALGAMVLGRRDEDLADLVDRVPVSEPAATDEEPSSATPAAVAAGEQEERD
ncbi:MAG: NADH-quinone oxidoreductase subunit J [Egibacteraceae bacterium]